MNQSNLPRFADEVSIDELTPGAVKLLEQAEEKAKDERNRNKGHRRRWSEKGALCAALAVEGVRQALVSPTLQNHAYAHRRFRGLRCSRECRIRDLWAVLWLGIQALGPSRDWPVRRMLAQLIEDETRYRIERLKQFADQVARDLHALPAPFAVSPRRRTRVQKRLIATYNVTADLLKGLKKLKIVHAREPIKT